MKTAGVDFGTCKQSSDAPYVALILKQSFLEM